MAAPRARKRRFGGVPRAIGRFLVLVVLGFGLGLAIGLISEEPDLVYGHLTGEGEKVALAAATSSEAGDSILVERVNAQTSTGTDRISAASQVQALPEVAAAPPAEAPSEPDRPTQSQRQPEPGQDSKLQPETVARDDAAGRWAIQVGAFSDEETARRLVKSLETKNYPVAVVPAKDSSQGWRVRVQPLRGEGKARALASRLKREEGLPTWLIPMEAGSRQ